MNEADDLIREFLIESHEGLDRLDRDLVALEQDPHDSQRLGSVFRAIHTIKGTCGFLGLTKLELLSHVGEDLLSRIRDGELALDAAVTTGLLSLVDAIRDVLGHIERDGTEGPGDYGALIARLAVLNPHASLAGTPAVSAGGPPDSPVVSHAHDPVEDERRAGDDRRMGVDRRASVAAASLRVDVGLVDELMGLVGELVLTRNEILQLTAPHGEAALLVATQRLSRVTSDLQHALMKTRMQPIGTIWSRLPRLVRDLAGICGKHVRLEMEGTATDLDRTIIDAIKDPLTHIIRNAVAHGIELPVTRLAQGKPAEGTIRLRAFHRGGQVIVEIADDGCGIDAGQVRARALAMGLLTPDQSARMSDQEIVDVVFVPGFSTAAHVTHLSGRGVGMDVVKTNIEKIGGTVGIESRPGVGTTLRITAPVTRAIAQAFARPT